jgi:hypothetical protein
MSPSPREDVRSPDSSKSGNAAIVERVVLQPQAKELLLNNTITLPFQEKHQAQLKGRLTLRRQTNKEYYQMIPQS